MTLKDLIITAAWDYFFLAINQPNADLAKVREEIRKINEVIAKTNELWPPIKL